jgi:hypothetical protein
MESKTGLMSYATAPIRDSKPSIWTEDQDHSKVPVSLMVSQRRAKSLFDCLRVMEVEGFEK